MDTATHVLMGFGIAGLSHLDPVVVGHPETAAAVMVSAVLGSNAPDADALFRLGGNGAYIRRHRGVSHALPMIAIWAFVISGGVQLLFPAASWSHLLLWTLISVSVHVFVDLFNPYGTQALRPFSTKWISWNVIPIFDPFIFILHVAGLILWLITPMAPGWLFASIYSILAAYYIWRAFVHGRLERAVRRQHPEARRCTVIPTVKWGAWHVVVEDHPFVRIGEITGTTFRWTIQLKPDVGHPAVEAAMKEADIQHFLYFTNYAYPLVTRLDRGYEVRWIDVRFHHKKFFPFIAVVYLDETLKPLDSYVGWLSGEQLPEKVNAHSHS